MVNVTRQQIIEEALELELSDDQMAVFKGMKNNQAKGAFLDDLIQKKAVKSHVITRHSASAISSIKEPGNPAPVPSSPKHFLDFLEERKRAGTSPQSYEISAVCRYPGEDPQEVAFEVKAHSYADAIQYFLKRSITEGFIVENIQRTSKEEVPAVIQLDDRVIDLTPSANNEGLTMMVGAITLHFAREGDSMYVNLNHRVSGENIDSVSISDADYLTHMIPNQDLDQDDRDTLR